MPFTFLPHQAPVVPLKIVAPRWFDGTALVIGSTIPDLVYPLDGTSSHFDAHAVPAQLWFCLPVTLVLTVVMKKVIAAPLGTTLPDLGPFHLRDYARLSAWRLPRSVLGILIVVVSALIGSFSHIGMDQFTHGDGWGAQNLSWLQAQAFVAPIGGHDGHAVYGYDLMLVGLTVVGSIITIWCAWYIGRRRLIRRWYPDAVPPEATASSRAWLVGWTVVGVVAGLAWGLATRHVGPRHAAFFRVVDLTLVGLLVGSVFARPRAVLAIRHSESGRSDKHSLTDI
jgi:hypothetical protein